MGIVRRESNGPREGDVMKLRLLSAVVVVLVVAVFEGRANAAPTPAYSVTCSAASAGLVEGTWQKAKLS